MDTDVVHANYYMESLFYGLVILLVDGLPEVSLTIRRLEVLYKQREFCFYPAWAYAIPAAVLKVPLSVAGSLVWTCLTYYVIEYTPQVERDKVSAVLKRFMFFRQLILLFAVHLTSLSMASICQTNVASMMASGSAILFVLLFGGFAVNHPSIPAWLRWMFWVSPITYGDIGLSTNEFLSPRWQKMLSANTTIAQEILGSRGMNFDGYCYWISLAALFALPLSVNVGFTLALTFLNSPGASRAIISHGKLSQIQGSEESHENTTKERNVSPTKEKEDGMQ